MELNATKYKLGARLLLVLALLDQIATIENEPNNVFLRNHPDKPQESPQSLSGTRATLARTKTSMTGHEWTEHFRCKLSPNETRPAGFRLPLSNLWFYLMHDCRREELAWRFKYVDELKPAFRHHVEDETIDERLANIIYSLSINNLFDMSFFIFNSGDALEDAKNEVRVAGPEVDDQKCERELETMSSLYEEMQAKLKQFRTADETTRANLSLEERHIRLARVLDSFGRYESGSLDAKVFLSGSYDECIGSQLSTADELEDSTIPMRYCWANMNVDRHLHPLLKNRKKFEHETAIPVVNVATCLPKSCHSKSFHRDKARAIVQALINSQMRLPDSIYVDESLQLGSVFCLVDGDSELGRIPTSGRLCLMFVGVWTLLCLGATLANRWSQSTRNKSDQEKVAPSADNRPRRLPLPSRLCACLDLSQSWDDFTSDKRPQDSGNVIDLDVLNPVKMAACAFCVAAHTALVLGSLAINPIQIAAYVDTSVLLLAALMTSVVVDTFFVISGILVAYISLKKLSRLSRKRSVVLYCEQNPLVVELPTSTDSNNNNNNKLAQGHGMVTKPRCMVDESKLFVGQWLVLSSNRYLRIVPLYALLFWFRRDVLNYLGQGPLWDHGLNRETASGNCIQEPWYMPFTFLSAFRQLSKQCFVPSWSISNDIFFGLFVPPIILMLLRRPKLAIQSTIVITVVSLVAAMDGVITSNPGDVWQFLDGNMNGIVLLFRSLSPLYSWPVYRACAFLVGTLAGYLLYDFETRHSLNKDENNNQGGVPTAAGWPKWMTGPATFLSWVFILVHLLLSIYANDLKITLKPYHRLFAFYFLNIDRLVWSLSNAVIFLQMTTTWRHGSWMRNFSSQKWRTMAKLNFPVIFVHWLVIIVYMGSLPVAPVFTLWHVFGAFSVIMLVSIALGALVHVVFENPIDKLIKREIFGGL